MQLQAHVGWLRGAPIAHTPQGLDWLVLPAGREPARRIRVDAALLSNTVRAVRTALREDAAALARRVGDVEVWKARVEAAVERLGPTIRDAAPWESARAARWADVPRAVSALAPRDPGLVPIVDALLVARALEPAALAGDFGALAAHDALARAIVERATDRADALERLFALLDVATERGAPPFLGFVADVLRRDPPATNVEAFRARLPLDLKAGWAAKVKPPPVAQPTAFDRVVRALPAIAALGAEARRGLLALLAETRPRAALAAWADRCDVLAALDAEARTRADWHPESQLVARVAAIGQDLPAPLALEEWIDAAVACSAVGVAPALARLLEATGWPERGRARVLEHWAALARTTPDERRPRFAPLLAQLSRWFGDGRAPERALWEEVLEGKHAPRAWTGPDQDLLELPSARLPTVFAAFRALPQLDETSTDRVVRLVSAGARDAAVVAARVAALPESLPGPFLDEIAPVVDALEPKDAAEWAALATVLGGDRRLRPLGRAATSSALRARLRRWLVDDPARAGRAADQLVMAGALGARIPAFDAPPRHAAVPAWATRYPPALHASLARLAGVAVDAEGVAAGVLSQDFPDDADLARQIAALTAQGRAPERVAALERRRATPRAIGEGRLANLAKKLDRASERLAGEAWIVRLREANAEALASVLGVAACPTWALVEPGARLIAAALALPADHRALALRLLQARAGPPPWDLRDAPQNRAVIAAHAARGIDLGPWLEGPPAVRATEPGGADVTLALEDDPLEIFLMGDRFDTCLSIGAVNFFSVFANAADVDKRVLHARDARGRVRARTLLALDDEGRLLVFHTYAHAHPEHHAVLAADFARGLAEAMGTVLSPSGRVRPRVARRWYDDGPRDVGQSFPALAPGSTFRDALLRAEPGAVVALAAGALSPRGIDPVTLPLVLALPVFDARPDLVRPLLRACGAPGALGRATQVRAGLLLHAAGDDAAARLFTAAMVEELAHDMRGDPDHFSRATLEVLLALDPARVLRLARTLPDRRRDLRRHWVRLYLAGRAYEALGRRRRALDAYRPLVADGWYGADEIRAAIARLERRP